jgi:hypothetical protein
LLAPISKNQFAPIERMTDNFADFLCHSRLFIQEAHVPLGHIFEHRCPQPLPCIGMIGDHDWGELLVIPGEDNSFA